MRCFIALAAVISCAGCTTLRPIEGRAQSIPVDQVVSVQRRQFSRAKTWVLAGAGVLVMGSIAYAISQAAPTFVIQ